MLNKAPEQSRWIYGLFDAAGHCVYVGQTRALWQRQAHHKTRGKNQNGVFEFRVIRKTTATNADRLERQVTSAYWRKGQCQLNKVLRGYPQSPYFSRGCVPVVWVETKQVFPSINESARHLEVSVSTIKRWWNGKSAKPIGVTPKKVSEIFDH